MTDQEIRKLQMLMRVRDFGATHTGAFPATSFGGAKFAIVQTVVAELEQHAVVQASSTSGVQRGTSSKKSIRAALRERLDSISRTARILTTESPGIEGSFRLPHSNSDQALLSTARAYLQEAAPLRDDLVQRELPADFLEELSTHITEFERVINSRNVNMEKRVSATAAIADAIKRGVMAVRELDVIVQNKFRDDPATLAAWASASHIERAPRRQNGEVQSPPI